MDALTIVTIMLIHFFFHTSQHFYITQQWLFLLCSPHICMHVHGCLSICGRMRMCIVCTNPEDQHEQHEHQHHHERGYERVTVDPLG